MAIPESLRERAKHLIQAEDVALDIMRRRVPDLRSTSLIEQDTPTPFALFRSATFQSIWTGDERFLQQFYISSDVFTSGLDADVEGPMVSDAVSDAFIRAGLAHDQVLDGLGWVSETRVVEQPTRRADWANSEGPVQYANLPHGYARFTALYFVQIKRANVGPNVYDY